VITRDKLILLNTINDVFYTSLEDYRVFLENIDCNICNGGTRMEYRGVISYSPLGGGLLTGKYGVGRKPAAGRLVEQEM
jgi:hypothetical protein